MASFFKNFGRGILYVLSFPFIILGIALYAVFGLFVFIFQFGKLIFLFFTGRTLFSDLEEDIKAKAILQNVNVTPEEEAKPSTSLSLYPSDSPVYTTGGYKSPVFEEKKEVQPEPEIEKEWEDDAND